MISLEREQSQRMHLIEHLDYLVLSRHGERDLSNIDPESIALSRRVDELAAKVKEIEAPARDRILARRKQNPDPLPVPIASWTSTEDQKTASDRSRSISKREPRSGRKGFESMARPASPKPRFSLSN